MLRPSSIVILAILVATSYFIVQWKRAPTNPAAAPDPNRAAGIVQSDRSYPIKVAITGTITHLFVREGDHVEPHQELVEIDRGTRFRAPFAGTVTSVPVKEGETIFPGSAVLLLTDETHRSIIAALDQSQALRVTPEQKASISVKGMPKDRRFEGRVDSVYSNSGKFFARIDPKTLPSPVLPGMSVEVEFQKE